MIENIDINNLPSSSLMNKIHFENIYPLYPNLSDFYMEDNTLFYKNYNSSSIASLELTNLYINKIDDTLYSYTPNEIFFILKTLVNLSTKSSELYNSLKMFKESLATPYINNEQLNNIYDKTSLYYKVKSILPFNDEELNKLFELLLNCVTYAYFPENENKPGSVYLRNLVIEYSNYLMTSSSNTSSKVRILSQNNTSSTEELTENFHNADNFFKVAGFANATLAISITVMIGIILAILTLAFIV